MSRRRTALMTAVATVLAVGAVAPPAWGAGPDTPFHGDLNGDGLTDRVTLAEAPPEECAVVVELGRPGGGFELPEAAIFPKPGPVDVDSCPDLGTVLDLGGDGTVELVVAWSAGTPPGVDHDMLVLRDFTPSVGFAGLDQPRQLGSADFDGDLRRDIYMWSDKVRRFATFLNTPDGRLVAGPMRLCGRGLAPQFRDFDRNGATDVVTAYRDGCAGLSASGVAVLLDNATVRDLRPRRPGSEAYRWAADAVDANADGRFDVRATNLDTGAVTHWIGDGAGGFTESPATTADAVYLTGGRTTVIRVLDNDAVTDDARLEITIPPRFGLVRVTDGRTVRYTPHPSNRTTDRFYYQVTQDGKRSANAVYVRFRS